MKRIFIFTAFVLMIFSLCSCQPSDIVTDDAEKDGGGEVVSKEYLGTPLECLTYETVDYMGGYTVTHIFDFVNNAVTKVISDPQNPDLTETLIVCEFTDEMEKSFIDSVYTYGLFDIDARYEADGIIDGGGWSLLIEYADGSTKRSEGSNASPESVFRRCSIPFFDLCGVDILGGVPGSYYTPPKIDAALTYGYNGVYFCYVGGNVKRGSYRWNGRGEEKNPYELILDEEIRLMSGEAYGLFLSTSNYNNYNGSYECFDECLVMSYDLNSDLTGGKEIFRQSWWFDNVEIPYEQDRLYVITLSFNNGDFVEYAFSTATLDQKIKYGEYKHSVYSEGSIVLWISREGSFYLEPFRYFDPNDKSENATDLYFTGMWDFEVIDGKEYLVLTSAEGETLVLDYCDEALFVDSEKSTLDLEKYNLVPDFERPNHTFFSYLG